MSASRNPVQRAQKDSLTASPSNTQQNTYQFAQPDLTTSDFADQYGPDAMSSAGFDPALFPPTFKTVPNPRQTSTEPSNQLMRRSTNNQLAPTRNALTSQQWLASPQQNSQSWEELTAEEDLNARAAIAKQEAQAKRKQIPPFVAKLWSFLDEDKNTDLIRWTDNGTAFTVLDEDEFARTLIPELFKHNNYASFVRQLNMYGFHKKVGLNANSMKAAEKKTKDPNVYWHEYFRQGREELLWLIQKPQTKSSATKRKRGHDGKDDSDDERRASPEHDGAVLSKLHKGDSDVVAMPKGEVIALRQEVQRLQRQQGLISKMITQLKDQNEQFYRQASEFQSLHDRHENSINAILTFLATFYNRSLEAGVDFANMFGNQNTAPQHGTVVDVGDHDFPDNSSNRQVQRYRKPQLLLQSSPNQDSPGPGRVSTQPPSSRPSASPPVTQRQTRSSARVEKLPSNTNSPKIKDEAATPTMDSGDMMSLINAANANTPTSASPQYDFTSALNHAQNANGQAPLTPQQRENMLNMIANQQNAAGHSQKGSNNNNALINPTPPPIPDLDQFTRNQEQLEYLTRLQREQDSKVQDLAGRLQPLSPNGSIPGLDAYGNQTPSADFDFDAFLNNPYTSGDGGEGADGGLNDGTNDMGFNFDQSADPDDLFADVSDARGFGDNTEPATDDQRVQSVHSGSEANEEDEAK